MPEVGAAGSGGWRCGDEELGDSAVWTISPREKDDAPRWENLPPRGALSISDCRRRPSRRRPEGRLGPARKCRSGTGVIIRLRKGQSLGASIPHGKFFRKWGSRPLHGFSLVVHQLPVRSLLNV